MPLSAAPRSVSDATRFTATTPHASSKTATPPPRFAAPRSGAGSVPLGGSGGPGGSNPGSILHETPEQKVARLRAAHRRAKEAKISKFDKIVDTGRRVFDSAHKITVVGLVGFTMIAGLATAYTAYDMITYNKKRSAEWVEKQKQLEADSLEAARVAYMTGKATEEQMALVEEQLKREAESGRKTSFFSEMSVLGAPQPAGAASATAAVSEAAAKAGTSSLPQQQQSQTPRVTETVSWPGSTTEEPSSTTKSSTGGLWAWLTSNLKKEETGDDSLSSQRGRLGWESLSEEDDGAGVRESDIVRAIEERQAYLKDKAHAALEQEKRNQRTGGPLDRVGLKGQQGELGKGQKPVVGEEEGEKPKKTGWW